MNGKFEMAARNYGSKQRENQREEKLIVRTKVWQ